MTDDRSAQGLPRRARRDPRRTSSAWRRSVTETIPAGHRGAARRRPARAPTTSSQADDVIDALSLELEERCYQVLALQEPVASDLRVGHHRGAADQRDRALRRPHGQHLQGRPAHLRRRARPAAARPHRPDERGGPAAVHVRHRRLRRGRRRRWPPPLDDMDDCLDRLHARVHPGIFESHAAGRIDLQVAVQLALVGRYYERIGDHAVNIGERVRYMVTGWLPEHTGAARLPAAGATSRARPTTARRRRSDPRPVARRRRARAVAGGARGATAHRAPAPAAGRAGRARSRPRRPARASRRRSISSSEAVAREQATAAAVAAVGRAAAARARRHPAGRRGRRRAAARSCSATRRRGTSSAPATATRSSRRPSPSCCERPRRRAPAAARSSCSARPGAPSWSPRVPLDGETGRVGGAGHRSRTSPSGAGSRPCAATSWPTSATS